jgi:uncharacterized damage-inducible protein DinB
MALAESGSPSEIARTIASPPVVSATEVLLRQCASFVAQFQNASECYTRESRTMKGGTVGKHVRHTLDHFRAAIDGHSRGVPIEYDRRERDVPMEKEPRAAITAIDDLVRAVQGFDAADLASPVRVSVMLTGDGVLAQLGSTLGRELAFAAHHAVHHHAMMEAIAREFGVASPCDFGLAPSTVNHVSRSAPTA